MQQLYNVRLVDGQWTEWHEQNCDASCRGRKVRYCDNPQPLRGGADCIGPRVEEYGNCSSFDCIQDGAWGSWNEWSDCSKSCSYGIQTRYRECDSPWPRNGGAPCPSSDSYISERTCYIDKCPKPLVHRKKYKPKSSDRDVDYALILSIIFGVLGGLTLILLIILTIRRTQLKKMRDKAVEEREKTPLYKEAAEMSVIPVGKRSAAAKLRRQNLKAKLKKPDEKKRPTTFIDTVFQFNEEFDDIGRPQSSLLRSDSVLSRPETATFDRPESRQVTLDSRADTPMMVKGLKQIDQQLREIGSVNPNDSVAGMTSLEAVLGITPGGKKLPSLGQETVGTNRLPPILPRGLPSLDAAMSTKGLKPVGVLPSLQVNTNSNTLKVPVTTHPQQLKGQGITLDEAMGGGKTSTKDSNAPMSREEEVDEIVENFWEVPRESIEMITTLATGSFGLVMKAKAWDLLSSQGASLVVIKELDPQASVATRNAFLKQLDVLKKLDTHTNVISLLGCCTILDPLYMVLEYAPNGELQSFLRRNRPHTPGAKPPVSKNLMNFAVQIAKGMAFLHKHKVSHGELSSQNILLGDRLVCKVSNVARVRNVVENVAEGRLGLRWMSPESICASVQNEQSDSWSFGVLLWEIVNFGSTPYPNMSEKDIKTRIKVGYRMPHSAHITKDLYNLMKYCWNDVPSKRPPLKALASTIWKMNVEGIEHIKVNEFNSKLCVDMDDMRPHTPGSILC
ncbi:uncharacterized protein [Antedon mediterranea]|uniref:uncharacterized protein isoform X2 n=1 Tax=Antedon mediterranea TaxID=105859 RepID=UPI003AF42B3A